MAKILCAIMSLLGVLLFSESAYAAGCGLNHTKIMNTLINPPKSHDLLFIVAHRGIHGTLNSSLYKDTPENSRESLDNADKECIEAVEIDVRLSSDGVPMITHDTNWGRELRTTDLKSGSCCFDPYHNAGYNPAVNQTTAAAASQWVVRPTTNLWGQSKWNEKGTTLNDMLNHYKTKGYEFIIFIDVKDSPAFGKAWAEVASHQMSDRVVLKIAANVFPNPEDLAAKLRTIHYACQCAYSDAAYIKVMPVYQTSDIAPNNAFGSGGGESKVVNSAMLWAEWNGKHASEKFVVGVETNIKQRGKILSSTILKVRDYVTVANFMPVIEDVTTNDGNYLRSDATCCVKLESYLYNGGSSLPSDTADERPLLDFVKDHVTGNYINMITTDNALGLAQSAAQWGRRNTVKYFR
jgi:glycerophosphoryl diester phosphodiesterase